MPDLHLLAGVNRTPTLNAVARDRHPTTVAQQLPDDDTVAVIPAPTAPTVEPARVEDTLGRLRETTRSSVLVNCPGGAGPDAAAPVRAADPTLVVAILTPRALRDETKTAATARALGTPVVGAVLTRATCTPESVADLLGCPVAGAVPPLDPPVLPRPRARAAYRELVENLRDK